MGMTLFYGFLFYILTNFSFPEMGKAPLLYSNQAGDDIKKIYTSALSSAEQSIYLEVYTLYDPDILNLLNNPKIALPIQVRYDGKASPYLKKKLSPRIEKQPVFGKGLMHRKITVIDDHLCLLGSANLTTSSLNHHDNLVIAINDNAFAKNLHYAKTSPFTAFLEGQKISLYFLPDVQKAALTALLSCLQTAKKSIHVAMFTLTHKELIQALIAAHQRGIETAVALDTTTAQGASRLAKEELQKAGVPLYLSSGKALFHHKWTVIDDTTLVMGSANWTHAAFKKNEDFLLFIEKLNTVQRKKIQKTWLRITTESTLQKKVA